jgi:hypothetical protein
VRESYGAIGKTFELRPWRGRSVQPVQDFGRHLIRVIRIVEVVQCRAGLAAFYQHGPGSGVMLRYVRSARDDDASIVAVEAKREDQQ